MSFPPYLVIEQHRVVLVLLSVMVYDRKGYLIIRVEDNCVIVLNLVQSLLLGLSAPLLCDITMTIHQNTRMGETLIRK